MAARIAAGDRAVTADARALVAAGALAGAPVVGARPGPVPRGSAGRRARLDPTGEPGSPGPPGLDAGAELVALEAAILRQDPAWRTSSSEPRRSPARGRDSRRTTRTTGTPSTDARRRPPCVARLDRHPMLVLAGPSGCGKSSLLRAGIVPLLCERGRQVLVMVPGQDPAATMATALAGTRGDPVWWSTSSRRCSRCATTRRAQAPGWPTSRRTPPSGRRWCSRCAPTTWPSWASSSRWPGWPRPGCTWSRRSRVTGCEGDRGTSPHAQVSGSSTGWSTCCCATARVSRGRCPCSPTPSPRPGSVATGACSP